MMSIPKERFFKRLYKILQFTQIYIKLKSNKILWLDSLLIWTYPNTDVVFNRKQRLCGCINLAK